MYVDANKSTSCQAGQTSMIEWTSSKLGDDLNNTNMENFMEAKKFDKTNVHPSDVLKSWIRITLND